MDCSDDSAPQLIRLNDRGTPENTSDDEWWMYDGSIALPRDCDFYQKAFAIDKNNDLWIAEKNGLSYLHMSNN